MASQHYNPIAQGDGLNEHLNYFNDAIQAQGPMFDSDFDDIFSKDFDLVFDPLMMQANPVSLSSQNHESHPQQTHRPVPDPIRSGYGAQQTAPMPMPAVSNSAPTQSASHFVSPVSQPKPVISQSVIQQNTQKQSGPAIVSPQSVTAVFESIPAAASAPPASSPRKRSYSMVSSKPAPKADPEPINENLSYQEQEDLRRERNRHHAKRSRQRKRDYMNQLEDAVNDMRKENERLFELLGMDSTAAKADMRKKEEQRAEVATRKFVAGLKQPRNRVLDNTTLAFLRELWK